MLLQHRPDFHRPSQQVNGSDVVQKTQNFNAPSTNLPVIDKIAATVANGMNAVPTVVSVATLRFFFPANFAPPTEIKALRFVCFCLLVHCSS